MQVNGRAYGTREGTWTTDACSGGVESTRSGLQTGVAAGQPVGCNEVLNSHGMFAGANNEWMRDASKGSQ